LSRSRRWDKRSRIWEGGERLDAGGCQLDSEGERVETGAELGDLLGRPNLRPLAEEGDGLGLSERSTGYSTSPCTRGSSRLVTRSVRLGMRRGGRRARRRSDHLLQVVDEEEQLAFRDVLGEPLLRPERLSDGFRDERRVAQGGEPHPEKTPAL